MMSYELGSDGYVETGGQEGEAAGKQKASRPKQQELWMKRLVYDYRSRGRREGTRLKETWKRRRERRGKATRVPGARSDRDMCDDGLGGKEVQKWDCESFRGKLQAAGGVLDLVS